MNARRLAPLAVAIVGLLLGGSPNSREHLSAVDAPVSIRVDDDSGQKVTKLLVVVEENHSFTQMKQAMPYTFGLARQFGYATRYYALEHPSLPNYIAIAGGKTYGVQDDAAPTQHRLHGHTVFGQALARGRSAAVYAQGLRGRCSTVDHGAYAVRHNPWTYFEGERRQCRAHNFAMTRFESDVESGTLPQVGMLIPDLNHDAHNGTLSKADAWFEGLMTKVFAGSDWKAGRLAVVLTADEDDRNHDNRVLTVVIHPSQSHHIVEQRLDHYSLTRLYDEVAGLPRLNHAQGAPSIAAAFGLPIS